MKKQTLILGDVFLDIFEVTEVLKISPERPVPVLKPIKIKNLLGGAANVANNIKSIGGSPFLISKLSNDKILKKIQILLKKEKIQFKIFSNKKYSSPIKKRIVENDHQFCRIDNEKIEKLTKPHEREIVKFIKKNIDKFEALVLSDYSKGFLTQSIINKTIKIFKKEKKKIFTDPKNKNIEVYKNSNFICPNQKEFFEFFDYQKLPYNKISTTKLFKKSLSEAFIVTKGSKGISIILKNGKIIDIPQKDINVYDVTGAGDTFIGILSYLISKNLNIVTTLKIASEACAKVVQKKHTSVLTFNEFKKIIEDFCESENIELNLKIILWKLVGLKVGVTNGCFDVLHSGHIHLINECKKNCDKLIVLINSDKSVKSLKGLKRPILDIKKRIKYLKLLKNIDQIEIFNEQTPEKIIAKISPNILFKGSDYKPKDLAGYKTMLNTGGKIMIIKKLKNFSSSKFL